MCSATDERERFENVVDFRGMQLHRQATARCECAGKALLKALCANRYMHLAAVYASTRMAEAEAIAQRVAELRLERQARLLAGPDRVERL